jgi:predicted hotdog family 3-hydroxylacyl-ACP dehydratase
MHDFIRDQYQISLGEIKMILAQTVTDWRPLLDNLLAYSQQSNPEGTIAILQRLKGQLAAIGLLEFSEQTVTIMQAFRQNDRERARNLTVTFVQNLSRIFKALEQEVTTTT